MGLRLHLDQGTCRIYEISSNNYLGFCQQEAPPAETIRGGKTQVTVTLVTPDVDGWYEYLGQQGVEFHKAPAVNATYNIYHRILRDPNGYLIEIQRFLQYSRLGL
jgi:hypothetical protein